MGYKTMIVQIMSNKLGHQELVVEEKRNIKKTLEDLKEISKGWHIQAMMKAGGEPVLLSPKQVEQQFDSIDKILIRDTLTAG